jgi:myosin heavy subunit
LLQSGDMCYFNNQYFNEEDLNGKSEPFFVGEVISKDNETNKCSIKILRDKFPMNEKDYLKKNANGDFEVEMSQDLAHQYSLDSENGIKDMIDMNELNNASLLHNIRTRCARNEIQTFVGPTLLIVNPYKRIPNLFENEQIK